MALAEIYDDRRKAGQDEKNQLKIKVTAYSNGERTD